MKTGRYTLSQLLTNSNIDQIIVPEIQRDYVWQKNNVDGLITSIFNNFCTKESLALDISFKNDFMPHKEIRESEIKFLTEEFLKLRYNSRIGFIYAYNDNSFANKYFLIDGQQRLTTLFLLLLALHSYKTDDSLKNRFKNFYFVNDLPRLDYKVRETSHNFLVNFIRHNLSDDFTTFSKATNFYNIYNNDVTVRNMLTSYEIIIQKISERDFNRLELIDYVENYIEFNYFDTNQSSQGEKLYLYMNSRGETLSLPELLKSVLIGRSTEKHEDAKDWEDWQNFFWINRNRTITGANSDEGFFHFLMMTLLVNAVTNANSNIDFVEGKTRANKLETLIRERKSEFLLPFAYSNLDFNIDWIRKCYHAFTRLVDIVNKENLPVDSPNWINKIKNYINYVSILGSLFFILAYPKAEDIDIVKIYMHLKNIQFYDYNSRNPQIAIIESLRSIKAMAESRIFDIADEQLFNLALKDYFFSEFDKKKAKLYSTPERDEWENLFWETTRDEHFNSFLEGNGLLFLEFCSEPTTPEEARKYRDLLRDKIFKENNAENHRQIALYGDYSVYDDGYGYLIKGGGIERWTFAKENRQWYKVITERENIIKNFLDNSPCEKRADDWIGLLSNKRFRCFDYMQQNKFLFQDSKLFGRPHVILLNKHQASENNSRELTIHILHKLLKGSWVWNYKTCVVDFDTNNHNFTVSNRGKGPWFIDVVYERGISQGAGHWNFIIGKRNKNNLEDTYIDWLITNSAFGWEVIIDDEVKKIQAREVYVEKEGDTDLSSAFRIIHELKKLLNIFLYKFTPS
ncbi:MAG: DUF262 domain-containing protein [Muribaculaceae bacterium]|nr:DUF262 domain-containing protein [Muribaculaceae bacterium]